MTYEGVATFSGQWIGEDRVNLEAPFRRVAILLSETEDRARKSAFRWCRRQPPARMSGVFREELGIRRLPPRACTVAAAYGTAEGGDRQPAMRTRTGTARRSGLRRPDGNRFG